MQQAGEGYYKILGGGIDAGETNEEALIREVREESGLVVIPQSIRECGKIIEKLKDDRKTIESKLLAQACTKEIDVAVLNEEADKSFEQLSKKPTEKEIIKRGKE